MLLCLVTLSDLEMRRAGLSASAELLVSICSKDEHGMGSVWLGWIYVIILRIQKQKRQGAPSTPVD